MGSVRRSGVFTTVQTAGMEFLKSDGTAPPVDSVLVVKDRGVVVPSTDISLNSVTINDGVLTYNDVSGLLVNGDPVGGSIPPTNIRYFILYNQNVNDPDVILTWPPGLWPESGPILVTDWVCSVVGFDYNYDGPQSLDMTAPRYIATCYPSGSSWKLRRVMPPTTPVTVPPVNAFMGFHIMAMRRSMCEDRRFTLPAPLSLVIDPSGGGIGVTWGGIPLESYPYVTLMQINWQTGTRSPPVDVPIAAKKYLIDGLALGTTYTITARYKQSDGALGPAATAVKTTANLSAPTVTLTEVTSTSMKVSWSAGTAWAPSVVIAWPGGTVTRPTTDGYYTITSLQASTSYTVNVAYSTGADTGPNGSATATTLSAPVSFGPIVEGKQYWFNTIMKSANVFNIPYPTVIGFRVPSTSSYLNNTFNQIVFPESLTRFSPTPSSMSISVYSDATLSTRVASAPTQAINQNTNNGYDTYIFNLDTVVTLTTDMRILFICESGNECRFKIYQANNSSDPLISIQNTPQPNFTGYNIYVDSYTDNPPYTGSSGILCQFNLV